MITLATYSVATIGSAFSSNLLLFAFLRLFTGLGIGGEYAAINSAVGELIPESLWPPATVGVAACFWNGGALGIGVLILRLAVPESPRWLMLRGRERQANAIVDDIESKVRRTAAELPAVEE